MFLCFSLPSFLPSYLMYFFGSSLALIYIVFKIMIVCSKEKHRCAISVEITKETTRHAPIVKLHCHATTLIIQCILQSSRFNIINDYKKESAHDLTCPTYNSHSLIHRLHDPHHPLFSFIVGISLKLFCWATQSDVLKWDKVHIFILARFALPTLSHSMRILYLFWEMHQYDNLNNVSFHPCRNCFTPIEAWAQRLDEGEVVEWCFRSHLLSPFYNTLYNIMVLGSPSALTQEGAKVTTIYQLMLQKVLMIFKVF